MREKMELLFRVGGGFKMAHKHMLFRTANEKKAIFFFLLYLYTKFECHIALKKRLHYFYSCCEKKKIPLVTNGHKKEKKKKSGKVKKMVHEAPHKTTLSCGTPIKMVKFLGGTEAKKKKRS